MRKISTVTVLALCLYGTFAQADSVCPHELSGVTQQAKPVEGYELWTPPENHFLLASVTVYDGHPRENASLLPDEQTDKGEKWILNHDGPNPRPAYVACGYHGTNVSLVKKLPDTVKSCTVRRAKLISIGGMPLIESVECK